jgi:hypothetical protein
MVTQAPFPIFTARRTTYFHGIFGYNQNQEWGRPQGKLTYEKEWIPEFHGKLPLAV